MTKEARAASIKALTENKDSGYTAADLKFLEAATDERLEAIETLAKASFRAASTKAEAETVIKDKHSADEALAAHAVKLKAMGDPGDEMKNAEAAKMKAAEDVKTAEIKAAELRAAAIKASGLSADAYDEQEWLRKAPSDTLRTLVADKKAQDAAHKEKLIASLKTAAAGVFTDEQLAAKSIADLEQLTALAKIEKPDYSGRSLPRAAASENTNVYEAPDPYAADIKALQARNVN